MKQVIGKEVWVYGDLRSERLFAPCLKVLAKGRDLDLLALDEAMEKLAKLHERQARIVELRFFGGLSLKDVAKFLGVSPRTVDGDWSMARAWLKRALAVSH